MLIVTILLSTIQLLLLRLQPRLLLLLLVLQQLLRSQQPTMAGSVQCVPHVTHPTTAFAVLATAIGRPRMCQRNRPRNLLLPQQLTMAGSVQCVPLVTHPTTAFAVLATASGRLRTPRRHQHQHRQGVDTPMTDFACLSYKLFMINIDHDICHTSSLLDKRKGDSFTMGTDYRHGDKTFNSFSRSSWSLGPFRIYDYGL